MKFTFFLSLFLLINIQSTFSQTSGGVMEGFGINSTLFPGVNFGGSTPPVGTVDWFKKSSGRNTIVQDAATVTNLTNLLNGTTSNPDYEVRMEAGINSKVDIVDANTYKLLIDAIWARDLFGGSGGTDPSAYVVSSKNGQDPAAWSPGAGNVLGKNDLIDVAGHMFRNITPGKKDLYFIGLINRAEPGGSAYMDFEFYVQKFSCSGSAFSTGGPDMGHTAFKFNPSTGTITKLGDIIFNLSLSGGGTIPGIEVRVWVSRVDYDTYKATPPANLPFTFGDNFDGAVNGAPYGYASIIPKGGNLDFCAYVNSAGQLPEAPPWGTKNSKLNIYQTHYIEYSTAEMGLNMSSLGLDNLLIPGVDQCNTPWQTFIIKTRSSEAFTAALKDFAGPYEWGTTTVSIGSNNNVLSCLNPTVTLNASPIRNDVTYSWRTTNGHFTGATNLSSATVDKPGTYYLDMVFESTGCTYTSPAYIISNPVNPFITGITSTSTVSCSGSDGTINISVVGGTPSFAYSWTGPNNYTSTSKDLTGLAPGNYTVKVTDSNGCQYTSSPITVLAKTPVSYNAVVNNISCFGLTNGSIMLGNVTGGISPLTYQWNNGKTTKDLQNISPGNYTLTITDGVGCKTIETFTISQPSAALSVTISKMDDPGNAGNGSATVTPSGGTTAYTYQWSKNPDGTIIGTNATLANIGYGQYSVIVTDANGCSVVKSVFIYEKERCFDGIDNDGNGLSDCEDVTSGCKPTTPALGGPLNPCVGDQVTYTVGATASGTFEWTLPANVSDVTYSGTHSVSLKWTSKVPAQICVRAVNADPAPGSTLKCLGNLVCVSVSPGDDPQTPSVILLQEGNF